MKIVNTKVFLNFFDETLHIQPQQTHPITTNSAEQLNESATCQPQSVNALGDIQKESHSSATSAVDKITPFQIIDISDHRTVLLFDPRENVCRNFVFERCFRNVDNVSFFEECNIKGGVIRDYVMSGYNFTALLIDYESTSKTCPVSVDSSVVNGNNNGYGNEAGCNALEADFESSHHHQFPILEWRVTGKQQKFVMNFVESLRDVLVDQSGRLESDNGCGDIFLEWRAISVVDEMTTAANENAASTLAPFQSVEDFGLFEEDILHILAASTQPTILSFKLTILPPQMQAKNSYNKGEITSSVNFCIFGSINQCKPVELFLNRIASFLTENKSSTGTSSSFGHAVNGEMRENLLFKTLFDNCCLFAYGNLWLQQNSYSSIAVNGKVTNWILSLFEALSRSRATIFKNSTTELPHSSSEKPNRNGLSIHSDESSSIEEYKKYSLMVVEALEGELKKVRLVKESLSKELGKIKKEILQFQQDVHSRYDLYEIEEGKKFETEKLMYQSSLESLMDAVNTTQRELLSLSKCYQIDIERYQQSIKDLQSSSLILKEKNASAEEDFDRQRKHFQNSLLEKERSISTLSTQLTKAETSMKTVEVDYLSQIATLKKTNTSLQETLAKVEKEQKLIHQENIDSIGELKDDVCLLQAKLDRSFECNKAAQSSIKALTQEKKSLTGKVDELGDRIALLEEEKGAALADVTQLREERKKYQKEKHAYLQNNKLADEIARLKEEYEGEKESLNEMIEKIREENTQLKKNESSTNGKMKQLAKDVDSEREKMGIYVIERERLQSEIERLSACVKKLEQEKGILLIANSASSAELSSTGNGKGRSSSNNDTNKNSKHYTELEAKLTELKKELDSIQAKRADEVKEAVNRERSAVRNERIEMQKVLKESQERIIELERIINEFSQADNSDGEDEKKENQRNPAAPHYHQYVMEYKLPEEKSPTTKIKGTITSSQQQRMSKSTIPKQLNKLPIPLVNSITVNDKEKIIQHQVSSVKPKDFLLSQSIPLVNKKARSTFVTNSNPQTINQDLKNHLSSDEYPQSSLPSKRLRNSENKKKTIPADVLPSQPQSFQANSSNHPSTSLFNEGEIDPDAAEKAKLRGKRSTIPKNISSLIIDDVKTKDDASSHSPIPQKLNTNSVKKDTVIMVQSKEKQQHQKSLIPSPRKLSSFAPKVSFMPSFESSILSGISFDSSGGGPGSATVSLNDPDCNNGVNGKKTKLSMFDRVLSVPTRNGNANTSNPNSINFQRHQQNMDAKRSVLKTIYDDFKIPTSK